MTVSVIIVTLNRPDCVQRCLDCLVSQDPQPDQLIVVDASPDDLTRKVVEAFPDVLYLRNENGYGRMTASRNIGVKASTGDIIAFLDDDAFAHPRWLEYLLATYENPVVDGVELEHSKVGAIGGRVLNNVPGEATDGVHQIGKLRPNGILCAHFGADPGKTIEVDHVLGANMSYRREIMAQLGGFREDYPGISGICEDSDMCLRVKRLGYHILFNPLSCVDHLAAPQAVGRRFDHRYVFYHRRNNFVLFIRNFGLGPLVLRYLGLILAQSVTEFVRKLAGAFIGLGVNIGGTITGIWCGIVALFKHGRDPIRHDADADAIRNSLMTSQLPAGMNEANEAAPLIVQNR